MNFKLTVGIIVVFGILLAGYAFWTPIKIRYYTWNVSYTEPVKKNDENIKALLDIGGEGKKWVISYLKKRYPVAGTGERDIIIDIFLDLGEEGEKLIIDYFKNRYRIARSPERIYITDVLYKMGEEARKSLKKMFVKRCRREMVLIKGGSFMMGAKGIKWAEPVHEVTLSDFYMDRYEITNEKFYVFSKYRYGLRYWVDGKIPEGLEDHPAVFITWKDAKKYADWIGMRLPTEAEWEYACRADSTGDFCFGNNEAELGEYAWYSNNSEGKLHSVGLKKPNKWGLFDMHGNIVEWCADWFAEEYYSKSPKRNPKGPEIRDKRVVRGGCYTAKSIYCKIYDRGAFEPFSCFNIVGFRLVRSALKK